MIYRSEWQVERRWRNQPVTRELEEGVFPWFLRLCAALLILTIPTGLYMVTRNAYVQSGYRATEQMREMEALADRERDLRVQLAELESLPRIEAWAERQGDLRPPASDEVVVWTGPTSVNDVWVAHGTATATASSQSTSQTVTVDARPRAGAPER